MCVGAVSASVGAAPFLYCVACVYKLHSLHIAIISHNYLLSIVESAKYRRGKFPAFVYFPRSAQHTPVKVIYCAFLG